MERWRPQSIMGVPWTKLGYPRRKSARGSPEPDALELEVNVAPKISCPKNGVPFKGSKRWRRTSPPKLTAGAPWVQLRLSAHWNRFSTLRLGSSPPQLVNSAVPESCPE